MRQVAARSLSQRREIRRHAAGGGCACRYYTQRYALHADHLELQDEDAEAQVDHEFAVVQEVVPVTTMGTVIDLMKRKRKLERHVVRMPLLPAVARLSHWGQWHVFGCTALHSRLSVLSPHSGQGCAGAIAGEKSGHEEGSQQGDHQGEGGIPEG